MRRPRGLVVALVLCAAGATIALATSGRAWVRVESRTPAPSSARPDAFLETTTTRRGGDLAPGARALALVSLAGTAALVGARGRGRQAVGVVLLCAGAGTAYLAAREVGSGTTAAVPACAAGGLLVLVGGALTAVSGGRWPTLGARYDAPADPGPRDDLADAWDALDGDDPTTGPAARR